MATSCIYIPQAFNKESNQWEDSQIFKEVMDFTGDRDIAKRTYSYIENKLEKENIPYQKNKQGEPTLDSMMSMFDWNKVLNMTDPKIKKRVSDISGFTVKLDNIKSEYQVLPVSNYKRLQQKVNDFNLNSPFRYYYKAVLGNRESSEKFSGIGVYLKDKSIKIGKQFSIDIKDQQYNSELYKRLREILSKAGVSVGALNELESRLGIKGVTDFSALDKATNQLVEIIRLAKGKEGELALPEEFAHFAVEALLDHPLVKRALNFIKDNNLVQEILGEDFNKYSELYNNDSDLLTKECLGKVLATSIENVATQPSLQPVKGLFNRVFNAIKAFFSNLGDKHVDSDLINSKDQLRKDMNKLSTSILSGETSLNKEDIKNKQSLYALGDKLDREHTILNKMEEVEAKRRKIFIERNYKFDDKQKNIIFNIQRTQLENDPKVTLQGIYDYLTQATNQMKEVVAKTDKFRDQVAESDLLGAANTLRAAKDYSDAYSIITTSLEEELNQARLDKDQDFVDKLSSSVAELNQQIKNLQSNYKNFSLLLFSQFLEKFSNGKSLVNPFKLDEHGNPVTLTLQDILTKGEDISFADLWANPLAEAGDQSLRLLDKAVKDINNNIRLKMIDLSKDIIAAHVDLEKSGIKNTEWIFEKDTNGVPTGRYIQKYRMEDFRKARQDYDQKIRKEIKNEPLEKRNKIWADKMAEWSKENFRIVNNQAVPAEKWENQTYKNMNEAQKTYYEKVMNWKEELDSSLPEQYTKYKFAPMIRKDFLERLKSRPKSILKESTKDWMGIREDNTEYGNFRTVMENFSGDRINTLPVFFTSKLDNMKDMSMDATSSLLAYAEMATNFAEKAKYINMLELGRDVIKNKEVVKKVGGKVIREVVKSFGKDIETPKTVKASETNIGKRLDMYYDAQLYGKLKKESPSIFNGTVNLSRAVDLVNEITSLNAIGFNTLTGGSNILTGRVMMRIEALANQYFSWGDLHKGDALYGKGLLDLLPEIGSRVKTSKLALITELFDIEDTSINFRDKEMDRRTLLSKVLKLDTFYFMSTMGEHYMHNRTALTMLVKYKMKDNTGKQVSLYDALEREFIDPNNHSKGAKLVIKDGYTKEDGTKFSKEDLKALTEKIRTINQLMHGVYNQADQAAMQQYALLRLVYKFRNWMPMAYDRRFQKQQFSYGLDEWTEGYYRTCGRFLWKVAKDLKRAQFLETTNEWKSLNDIEKANVKRAAVEIGTWLTLAIALGLTNWSNDKNSPWAVKYAEYQAYRLKNEIGSMTPTIVGTSNLLQIVQSPAASISYANRALNIFTFRLFDTVKSGPHAGMTYAKEYALDLIPFYRVLAGNVDPSLRTPYYKRQ